MSEDNQSDSQSEDGQSSVGPRPIEAAASDARAAVIEFDDAVRWLDRVGPTLTQPLAVEVWVFDEPFERVLLVHHRWRHWVPPGGKGEPGELPRQAAARELFEETGLLPELLARPAAAAVRSYHPDFPATLGLSYVAIAPASTPVISESGQPAAWTRLDEDWHSYFPDDPARIRAYALRWRGGQRPTRSAG